MYAKKVFSRTFCFIQRANKDTNHCVKLCQGFCDDPLVKQLNMNIIKLVQRLFNLTEYNEDQTPILSIKDNFLICLLAQLNIEFPLNLTTNFPSVKQFWAIKSVSLRECQKFVTKEVSTVVFLLASHAHMRYS